jgi:hypothetical protein
MRSMFRTVLAAFTAVLVLGAVASASALAHEWKVNGKALGKGEKKEVTYSGGKLRMGPNAFEVTCSTTTGKGKVQGPKGFAEPGGKGEATELKVTGCQPTSEEGEKRGCKVKTGGLPTAKVGEIIATDLPTELTELEKRFEETKKRCLWTRS